MRGILIFPYLFYVPKLQKCMHFYPIRGQRGILCLQKHTGRKEEFFVTQIRFQMKSNNDF